MTSPEARFWAKVDKSGDCWLWTGYCDENGYGQFYVSEERKKAKPHRYAYELLVGPIPEDQELNHRYTCLKRCLNPAHMRPSTHKQNHENRAGANRNNSSSGIRGVTWDKSRSLWSVQVMHNRKNHKGGRFADLEDATAAAVALRLRLFTHSDADLESAS